MKKVLLLLELMFAVGFVIIAADACVRTVPATDGGSCNNC
jgi:hypothetical protein